MARQRAIIDEKHDVRNTVPRTAEGMAEKLALEYPQYRWAYNEENRLVGAWSEVNKRFVVICAQFLRDEWIMIALLQDIVSRRFNTPSAAPAWTEVGA